MKDDESSSQKPTTQSPEASARTSDRIKAALLGAVVGAAITAVGSYINTVKNIDAKIFEVRTGREAAVQALRGELFATFSQHVAPQLDGDFRKVALLAALHSNFSQFFDSRAVFEAFSHEIGEAGARQELKRLAKRVARHQAEYLKAHKAESKTETLSTGDSGEDRKNFNLGKHGSITVHIEGVHRDKREYAAKEIVRYKEDDDEEMDDVADFVNISVDMTPMTQMGVGAEMGEPITFDLSYMDAPYFDNIWMEHADGEYFRLALILKDIDKIDGEFEVTIEAIHFPDDWFSPTELPPARGHARECSPPPIGRRL